MKTKRTRTTNRNENEATIAPGELDLEEWDFSGCPGDERSYCLKYELARESQEKIRWVEHARRVNWRNNCPDSTAAFYYAEEREAAFFSSLPHFPSLPWLKIPALVRTKALKDVSAWEGPLLSIDPNRLFDDTGEYREFPTDTASGHLGFTTVHAIEVDWTASNDAIKAKFEKWLAQNRPPFYKPSETRGRTDAIELLRFLGAFRLLRTYGTCVKVIEIVNRTSCGDLAPKYTDESSWRRAARHGECLAQKGYIYGPGKRVTDTINNSSLSRVEKARAKGVLVNLSRLEQRQLAKLKDDKMLEELERRYRKGV